MTVDYEFTLDKPTRATPRFPALDGALYESPLGGRTTRQGALDGGGAMSGDGQSADGPGADAAARAWSWSALRLR